MTYVRMPADLLGMALLAATSAGCAYSKESVPVYRENVALRVPNQQRLIALAVDEAVARLDFSALKGKRAVVEVAGVFPHSKEDVLNYVRGKVEGRLAMAGVAVQPMAPLVVAPAPAAEAAEVAAPGGGAMPLSTGADYRVVVGVSWAGVDVHDKKAWDPQGVVARISVGVAGVALGAVSFVADGTAGGVLGTVLVIGGPIGAGVWWHYAPPNYHIYRLLGRARLTVQAIPLRGGVAFETIGEGSTQILVDESSEEGYVLEQPYGAQ